MEVGRWRSDARATLPESWAVKRERLEEAEGRSHSLNRIQAIDWSHRGQRAQVERDEDRRDTVQPQLVPGQHWLRPITLPPASDDKPAEQREKMSAPFGPKLPAWRTMPRRQRSNH